jgi:hypothetical protein
MIPGVRSKASKLSLESPIHSAVKKSKNHCLKPSKKSKLIPIIPTSPIPTRRYPKRSIHCKSRSSQIKILEKDFLTNFGILDADKSGLLNYSRFSILLQSMFFIDSPMRKTKEERELTLKAWKLITTKDSNSVWKNNAFTLFLSIMNLHDKSLPTHSEPPGLGRVISGIYCVRKEETKNIHKAFVRLADNRRKTYLSTSPENRPMLRKNLSFEDKRLSISPERDEILGLQQTKSVDLKQNSAEKVKITINQPGGSISEEETGNPYKDTIKALSVVVYEHSGRELSRNTGMKESDSINISDNDFSISSNNSRIRLRLTTQICGRAPSGQKERFRRDSTSSKRSFTAVDKDTHFEWLMNKRFEDGEETKKREDTKKSSKENRKSLPLKLTMRREDEDAKSGKIIMNVLLPNGVQEVLLFYREEVGEGFINECLEKYGMKGESAKEFREQFYRLTQQDKESCRFS